MSEQPLVERLHAFFVQVFTTYDLSDKDKRQEMKLLSFELDDEVAQLEEDKERLLEQLVAGEELYISRGIEIVQLEAELNNATEKCFAWNIKYSNAVAENAALKRENEGLREAFGYICDDSLEDVLADKKEQADALAALEDNASLR